MSINNEMISKIKKEWGSIEPHNHYATLFNHELGYSFGCFFSVADDFNGQKKVVFSITNLSTQEYQLVNLTSVGNVELIEKLYSVARGLFPDLSFNDYRELIFDLLDENVIPVLKKYEFGFPSNYQMLEASNKVVEDGDQHTSFSTFISYQDVKFNYKMIPIIEDIIRKGEGC